MRFQDEISTYRIAEDRQGERVPETCRAIVSSVPVVHITVFSFSSIVMVLNVSESR